MAYTTNQLISNAYYASEVVSRSFQTVSGEQFNDGLMWLNEVITEKTVDKGMIPYETTYTFTATQADGTYDIPNCIQIDTLVFYKDSVRYAMKYEKRNEYFGTPRVENVNALPYQWYFERGLGGGTLYIYFKPDQSYSMEVHGIFRLSEVSIGQDLTLTLDRFYITYLKYALADRICTEFGDVTPPNVAKQLARLESYINNKSRSRDLRMQKVSCLNDGQGYNWAYVNLGRGFVPY